jgi:hypothetical protein
VKDAGHQQAGQEREPHTAGPRAVQPSMRHVVLLNGDAADGPGAKPGPDGQSNA